MVTNSTFKIAPWADALYAMDRAWWKVYITEVRATFRGALYSAADMRDMKEVTRLPRKEGTLGNSGAGAIDLAARAGARRIILLGYDCKYADDGRRHWFGDHPQQLGNAGRIETWPSHFKAVRERLASLEIINCSRDTALDIFPRAALEEVL